MARVGFLLAVFLGVACPIPLVDAQCVSCDLDFDSLTSLPSRNLLGPTTHEPEPCEVVINDQTTAPAADTADDSPWSLFGSNPYLQRRGIEIDFQLHLGITTNSRNPTNPASGLGNQPATLYNYLNDQAMMNQLLITLAREPKSEQGRVGFGWHVDLVYGTDYIFLQSRGLETNNDFSNRWNSDEGSGIDGNSRMGLALPQLYFQTVLRNWTTTVGHFYSPLGYETTIPVLDQFYSNTYGFNFNFETPQVTGMMFERKVGKQTKLISGFHRGISNWTDNNNDLNGFGGIQWNSRDGSTDIEFVFDIGKENDAGTATRYLQSFVLEKTINDSWSYVLTSDYASQQELAAGGATAYWYNVVQYATYTFNDNWNGGVRFEWFDDIDGVIVSPASGPGIYYALSCGLNYQRNANVLIRPEIRWDDFDADGVAPSQPFGNGANSNQFMAAVDCVLSF